MSSTYKLFVPKKVEEKIRYLIRKFPHTEWSGVLFIKHTGSFENNDLTITCEDLYPMDLGTSGWTEFKMNEDVTAYMAENIELFECDLALCHSHHSLGAFFSGQDIKTLQVEGNDTNCFVSLIVDTKGTYQAAITRKVREKKELTTYYFGKSYEFFGEGEIVTNPPHKAPEVCQKTVEEERIEYFMLDVQVEQVSNPLDYLDARFAEIEAQKKQSLPISKVPSVRVPNSIKDEDKDKDFHSWIHSERKKSAEAKESLYAQPSLFGEEVMEEMVDPDKWLPDPTIIHYLVCQLLTSSLIVNKDIDLKQWVVKHMQKKYDEIFGADRTVEFDSWADAYVEFIVNHYNDPEIPAEVYNDWDTYISKIAEAIQDELAEYPSNNYLEGFSEVLSHYIMVEV